MKKGILSGKLKGTKEIKKEGGLKLMGGARAIKNGKAVK